MKVCSHVNAETPGRFSFDYTYVLLPYVLHIYMQQFALYLIYYDHSVYFHELFLLIFLWITPKNLCGLVSFLLSI